MTLKLGILGVSLTYINNNYIRKDGSTPVSGSIDMNSNTLYKVPDPVNPQDVATKEYADNVRGGGWVSSVKMRDPSLYAMPSRCPRSLRCFWG